MKIFTHFLLIYWCSATILIAQPAMVLIRGAAYQMGDARGDADEKPVHRVVFTGFYMAGTETTCAEFQTFADATGYITDAERGDGSYVWDSLGWHKREGVHWRHDESGRLRQSSGKAAGQYPVEHVSWNDAVHYCNWLSELQGLKKVYYFEGDSLRADFLAYGYRLPTEAEWEYAATFQPAGPTRSEDNLNAIGWYAGNTVRGARPVGLKKANSLHLYDMTGNVWEWCHDWYGSDFYAKSRDAVNPTGPNTGRERCLRGGSWNNNAAHCRTTNRTRRFPDFRDGSIGFRVVKRY